MFFITMFDDEDLKDISEQILKDKKVVIGIFKENELEKYFIMILFYNLKNRIFFINLILMES